MDHIKPFIQEPKISKSKLADGLARMDVLQQSGLDFDFPIIEALIMWIDKNHKDTLKALLEQHKDDPAEAQKHIDKPLGAVLVFLTGWGDIERCQRILEADLDKDTEKGENRFVILQLHGSISHEQQQLAFKKVGWWKIWGVCSLFGSSCSRKMIPVPQFFEGIGLSVCGGFRTVRGCAAELEWEALPILKGLSSSGLSHSANTFLKSPSGGSVQNSTWAPPPTCG